MSTDKDTADLLEHARRVIKAVADGHPDLTEHTQETLVGAMFGVLLNQRDRYARRTRAAMRAWTQEAKTDPIFRVFQFATSAGRWGAAQRIKALRRQLRELRAALH